MTNVLIIGGTGSLGRELARQLYAKSKITIFSRDEHKQQDMRKEFPLCEYVIGDVRDERAVANSMKDQDHVYLVAALKHVDVSEKNIFESVLTNVIGTYNVINAARECDTPFVSFSSSDKAVHPVNVYGMTKAIAERMLYQANLKGPTKFMVFRWGNIIGSQGSAIPYFIKAINANESVNVTSENMTRYWLTIEQAASFMIEPNCTQSCDKPFIPPMKAAGIIDMLNALGERLSDQRPFHLFINPIGVRPGEKMHEQIKWDFEVGPPNPESGPSGQSSESAERYTRDELIELLNPTVERICGY